MSEQEAATSSSEAQQQEADKRPDFDLQQQPETKRRKTSRSDEGGPCKLEEKLGGILCCVVCLDLPRAAVYQCSNGHLLCAGCFTHLLADARLRDEAAICPNCRIEISKTTAIRNLAAENAVSELPSQCQYCGKQFPRNSLERHEDQDCEERLATCKFVRIGCPWRGPEHERIEHEKNCAHLNSSGQEIMGSLLAMDHRLAEEKKLYENIFDLLGYENISFSDIQLRPYRTDEFVHRLYYESSRFQAFANQWVVKAKINSQKDPSTQAFERDMMYQLILKTRSSTPLVLNYGLVRGPVGDIKVKPRIYKFEFTEQNQESPYVLLPLPDTGECNRLLAAKTINFRLLMFWE